MEESKRLKTIDYSYIHPEEKWTGRANTLKQITDLVVNRTEFQGKVKVDRDLLQKVIYKDYPKELQAFKEKHKLEKLDRHKVGALSTILVYKSKVITIPKDTSNAFCYIAEVMHSVYLGLSRIGNPHDLVSKNESAIASIYTQLHHEKADVISLANQYFLIEESKGYSKSKVS